MEEASPTGLCNFIWSLMVGSGCSTGPGQWQTLGTEDEMECNLCEYGHWWGRYLFVVWNSFFAICRVTLTDIYIFYLTAQYNFPGAKQNLDETKTGSNQILLFSWKYWECMLGWLFICVSLPDMVQRARVKQRKTLQSLTNCAFDIL